MKFLGLILMAVLVGAPLSGPVQAGEVVEVVLVDRLDDQRGFCLDILGYKQRAKLDKGSPRLTVATATRVRSPWTRGSTATPSRRGGSTCPASTCA